MKKNIKLLFTVAVAIVLVGVVAFSLNYYNTQSSGPKEVVLNKQVCDFCGMHVGDIRYAAQIQTDTETYFYDDMGCVMHDRDSIDNIQAIYYHHYYTDQWVPEDAVVFIEVEQSPMGHGLAAIFKSDSKESYPGVRVELEHAMSRILKDHKTSNNHETSKSHEPSKSHKAH